MEEASTFEEAAKKSWQSFSTMKRFVSEANRLENASWRLWFMQKRKEASLGGTHSGTGGGTISGTVSATSPTALTTTKTHLPCIGEVQRNTTATPSPSSPPRKPAKKRLSSTHQATNCCVLCVYCEIQRASLSCHGCCHDAYCVSCFKLIHKRGNLATHTAVKLEDLHGSSSSHVGNLTSNHIHNHSHRNGNSLEGGRMGHFNGKEWAANHQHQAAEPARIHQSVGKEEQEELGEDASELNGDELVRQESSDGSKRLWNKPWEVQMDLLLQRLMMNSLPSEGDISVRNIDSRQELLEFDHEINTLKLSPASLDLPSSLTNKSSPSSSSTLIGDLLSSKSSKSSMPTPKPSKRVVCANCKGAHKTIDCPSLMPEGFVLPPPVTNDSKVSHVQQVQPPMRSSSPAFGSLFNRPKAHSVPTTPVQYASSPKASPIQIAVSSKTSRKKKTMVCANCQGNHMTIECALLENSMSPTANANVDTMLRKCFTTLHNDNSSNSTHAFLGDEISVHGAGNFGVSATGGFGMGAAGNRADLRKLDEFPVASGMMPISEDAIAIPEEAQLIALGSAATVKWSRDSWLLSCLAMELPTDVFVQLRKIHAQCQNADHDHDHDVLDGWVQLSSNARREWHSRYVRLHRNMLWEFLDDEVTTRPLGFANVNEAIVDLDQLELSVKFFQRASSDLRRKECFMRFESARSAQEWRSRLDQASHLSIEHLFNLSPDGQSCLYEDIPTDTYELGKGRFSSVRRACRRNMRRPVPCALKIIDKLEFWNLVENETEREDTLVREILTQSVLTMRCGWSYCPVIRLQSLLETRQYLVLELELMQEGDLHEEIVTTNAIDEYHASFLAASLVHAITYCQENRVAHRDIKLSNLALSCGLEIHKSGKHRVDGDNEVRVLKLADFGMATFIREDGTLRGRCGTPGFVAPEILTAGKGEAYPSGVDMFSVGVVLYTMLCGYEPFFGVTDEELIAVNKTVTYDFDEPEWSSISSEAKDLIEQMMEKDTTKRVTPARALAHPFLRDASAQLKRLLVGNDLELCQIELL